MSLAAGTRLGPYEITAAIGAGGMGEVYRAKDTKLNRDVALKILPEAFTSDADRLARFRREAQVLASLNHPNIAAIYGFEDSGATHALVMELVEGEDLSAHIARGSIPLADALPIAKQIADALEAAHEQGIVHRDLKPQNLKVRADGTVKVLDFGLAKAMEPAPTSDGAAALANSPTITSPALTERGVILGTAAYMSPEQAAGRAVDRRTDLWAFGVVLFEMLTGHRLFDGPDAAHVIAAVIKSEPDWGALPAGTPAVVRRLLRRCLEKDRKRRLDSAAAARLDIDDALAAPSTADGGLTPPAPAPPPPSSRIVPWALVAALTIALAIASVFVWRDTSRERPLPVYASINAPADYVIGDDDPVAALPTRTPMAFTPDGRSLVILAARANRPQLFLQSLDRPDARPIAGTDDAHVPFVSPDGKWVGFWSASELMLKKVPIEGGVPTTICPLRPTLGPNGAAWGTGDIIVFGDQSSGRIMRVPASGGTPEPVTAEPSKGRHYVAPFFLPDGRRILFSDVSAGATVGASQLMVQSLDGGNARLVIAGAADGRLLPSGQLVFMRLGTLMLVPFDVGRAQVTGDAVVAMGGVMQSGLGRMGPDNMAAGMFAVSSLGTLAVVRGTVTGLSDTPMIWMTPDGRSSSAEPGAGALTGIRRFIRISPDGSRAVAGVTTATGHGLWIADWTRDRWTECIDCVGANLRAVWSPDGARLAFGKGDTIISHALDSSTPDQVLVQESNGAPLVGRWLKDWGFAYNLTEDEKKYIKLLDPGSHTGRVVASLEPTSKWDVSPDGRWLAYDQKKPAQAVADVFVQAIPGPGLRMQVSVDGGGDPAWSADGRTLYYVHGRDASQNVLVAVAFNASSVPPGGKPHELFQSPDLQTCYSARCYDVSPDGTRFLMPEAAGRHAKVTRMELITNWTGALLNGR